MALFESNSYQFMPRQVSHKKPALFISPRQMELWGISTDTSCITVRAGNAAVNTSLSTTPHPCDQIQCHRNFWPHWACFPE